MLLLRQAARTTDWHWLRGPHTWGWDEPRGWGRPGHPHSCTELAMLEGNVLAQCDFCNNSLFFLQSAGWVPALPIPLGSGKTLLSPGMPLSPSPETLTKEGSSGDEDVL